MDPRKHDGLMTRDPRDPRWDGTDEIEHTHTNVLDILLHVNQGIHNVLMYAEAEYIS